MKEAGSATAVRRRPLISFGSVSYLVPGHRGKEAEARN